MTSRPGMHDDVAPLSHSRSGSGEPLVLLHALGLARSWQPVIPALAERFDVLAVDLPGFGESQPLPPSVEPTPAAMAAAVATLLDDLGIGAAHLVGNSLGGWVALELAALRPTASLTLLAPAGLWRQDTPRYCRISLGTSRWLAEHAPGVLSRLVGHPVGRTLVLGQSHGRPWRMTPQQARAEIADLGTSPGFPATFRATLRRRYEPSAALDAPVTVAFGSRDFILLPRQSRHVERLPRGTHVVRLPGSGHIPMTDDPEAVTALIGASTVRARPAL